MLNVRKGKTIKKKQDGENDWVIGVQERCQLIFSHNNREDFGMRTIKL